MIIELTKNQVNKLGLFGHRWRLWLAHTPESGLWLLSVGIWIWLLSENILVTSDSAHVHSIHALTLHSTLPDIHWPKLVVAVQDGLGNWMVMVVAMMFPLLAEPVRRVAFSNLFDRRFQAVVTFLLGYGFIWGCVGIVYLASMFFTGVLVAETSESVGILIASAGFLLAAFICWIPSRRITLSACSITIPFRIQGWQSTLDCFSYGLTMGRVCVKMCWAPMAALMLANHNFLLMCLVTIILIYERYGLPHKSKFPSYAWLIIAIVLFASEYNIPSAMGAQK